MKSIDRSPWADALPLSRRHLLASGFHWPYPGVGYAEGSNGAYRYVPEG